MKSLKFLFLAVAVVITPALAAKGATEAGVEDILGPLAVMDDIKTCQTTLKNLDQLLELSKQLCDTTGEKYRATRATTVANPGDSKARAVYNDAAKDNLAASQDYNKLLAWRKHISNRIAYDQIMLEGHGISAASRDAAKEGIRDARQSATDAARQTGSEAARGTANCADGH